MKTNQEPVMFEGDNYTLINQCGYFMEDTLTSMTEDDKKRFIEEANQYGSELDHFILDMIPSNSDDDGTISSDAILILYDRMWYATTDILGEEPCPLEIKGQYSVKTIQSIVDEMVKLSKQNSGFPLETYLFNRFVEWHKAGNEAMYGGEIHQSIEFQNEELANETAQYKCMEVAEKYCDEGYNEMFILPMELIKRVNLNDEWLAIHKNEQNYELSSFNTKEGGENESKS